MAKTRRRLNGAKHKARIRATSTRMRKEAADQQKKTEREAQVGVSGINLTDKLVVLKAECYKGDERERVFRCERGFGCHPQAIGTAIFGYFVHDGERCRVERYEVERLAPVQLVDAVRAG